MQVKIIRPSKTAAELTIVATPEELASIKKHVLTHFNDVKVPGFRAGKAPAHVLEKNVDANLLQTKFLEEAVEQLYVGAINAQKLRPVDRPEVSLTKFVPFTALEFGVKVAVVGDIKVADYKKIKLQLKKPEVSADDIKNVMTSLQNQMAEKVDVERPAKQGDQAYIDFSGKDAKGQPVKGAEGKDYPIIIGSKTFIPGFEDNLVGLKPGENKTFTLTFPKDYGVKALANKKVTFDVTVTKVQEVKTPKADDDFASKAGPFKTVAELKADIKKQLEHERKHEARRDYESELLKKITDKSTAEFPDILVNDQIERFMADVRQNLAYRGQTMVELLESEGLKTEDEYKQKVVKPQATDRVKASLILSEIADMEGLEVTPEELEVRMQLLKGQYQDPAMQAELSKPGTRKDIAARMLTEKTMEKLTTYASK